MTNQAEPIELSLAMLTTVTGGQSTGAEQAAGVGQAAGPGLEAWLAEPRVFRPSRGPHFMPLKLAG